MGQFVKRAVLSSPASPRQIQMLNQVILAVSALGIMGAFWIILSFCVSWRTMPQSVLMLIMDSCLRTYERSDTS
jgi:hypothetical protein